MVVFCRMLSFLILIIGCLIGVVKGSQQGDFLLFAGITGGSLVSFFLIYGLGEIIETKEMLYNTKQALYDIRDILCDNDNDNADVE